MSESLPELRRLALECATPGAVRVPLGAGRIDAALGGGLALARLHELYPAEAEDAPAACGFAVMLALTLGGRAGNIVWIGEEASEKRLGRLYPPGLAELGADPARLLFVVAPDAKSRTAADVVRSPAAGIAVIAPNGLAPGMDLTATRRLTLFAERSGVTAILLRSCEGRSPTAAATRWCVRSAPSRLLDADAPGHTALLVELVRQRAGAPLPPFRVEWDRDRAAFAAPLSGAVPADAGGGLLATG